MEPMPLLMMRKYQFFLLCSAFSLGVGDLSTPSGDNSSKSEHQGIVSPVGLPRVSGSAGGFGISYNLGHGGYASFSLPAGHGGNSQPGLHLVTPAPPAVPVPIFLNNPLYQPPAPAQAYSPPVYPSNLYLTHFNTINSHQPPPPPPPPLPALQPAFTPSRPDKIPAHLHPALHPLPALPVHRPHYTPPPAYSPPQPYLPPVLQYDPFEFQKAANETESAPESAPGSPLVPQLRPAPAFPPVNSPPPPSASPFPPVSLPPLGGPGVPPLPPLPPPLGPDDFPEYDAVPASLGPLIHGPGFTPAATARTEDPAVFLFTANRGFGLPTSERLKRKNGKTSRMINSHGGPVVNRAVEECSSPGQHHQQEHRHLLVETFPGCSNLMGNCGLARNDTEGIRQYGVCLNINYPTTVTLNLGRTLSSGHGSVSFSSDAECTDFVHQFFPHCGEYLSSCHQVEQDTDAAGLILGCLFSQYPSLMIPLLNSEEQEQLPTNIL